VLAARALSPDGLQEPADLGGAVRCGACMLGLGRMVKSAGCRDWRQGRLAAGVLPAGRPRVRPATPPAGAFAPAGSHAPHAPRRPPVPPDW